MVVSVNQGKLSEQALTRMYLLKKKVVRVKRRIEKMPADIQRWRKRTGSTH